MPYVCTMYDVDNTSMALKNIKPKSTSSMIPVVRTNNDVTLLTAQKAGTELNTVAILIDDKKYISASGANKKTRCIVKKCVIVTGGQRLFSGNNVIAIVERFKLS